MKTKNTLLVIAGILLALLTIKTCKLENELQTSNGQLQTLIDHPVTKTDTVWETKIIQPPKELPNEVKPAKVTLPKESQSLGGELGKNQDAGNIPQGFSHWDRP